MPNALYMLMGYDLKIERSVHNTVWSSSKLELLHARLLDAVAAIVLRRLQAVEWAEHDQHSKSSCMNLPVQRKDSVYSSGPNSALWAFWAFLC